MTETTTTGVGIGLTEGNRPDTGSPDANASAGAPTAPASVLGVTLSRTHVTQRAVAKGGESSLSLPLQAVSSISFRYDAPIRLLVGAMMLLGVSLLFGMSAMRSLSHGYSDTETMFGLTFASLVLGLGLLKLFFSQRKQALVIATASDKIVMTAVGADKAMLLAFAAKVEQAQVALMSG